MRLNPLRLLISLLEDPEAFLTRRDLDHWPRASEAWLMENEWLINATPAGIGSSIPCPECDDGHPVLIEEVTINDNTVWIAGCERLGAVALTDDDRRRWRPSPIAFMRWVKDGLSMISSNEQTVSPDRLWIVGHQTVRNTALRVVVVCGVADLDLIPSHSGPTALIHFGRQSAAPDDPETRLIDGSLMLEWSNAYGVTFKPDILHKQYPSETWPTADHADGFHDPNILFIDGTRYLLPDSLTPIQRKLLSVLAPQRTTTVRVVMRKVWNETIPKEKKGIVPSKLSKLLGQIRPLLKSTKPYPQFTFSQQVRKGKEPFIYRKALVNKELGDSKIHHYSPSGRN